MHAWWRITPKGVRGMQLCDMCQHESRAAVILATEQGTLCPIYMRPTCMMPVGYIRQASACAGDITRSGAPQVFNAALTRALTDPARTPEQRREALARWAELPEARFAHPREDHLMPLHVVRAGPARVCMQVKPGGRALKGNPTSHDAPSWRRQPCWCLCALCLCAKGWHGETASPPGGGRRVVRRGEHRVLRLPHGRQSLVIQVCLRAACAPTRHAHAVPLPSISF